MGGVSLLPFVSSALGRSSVELFFSRAGDCFGGLSFSTGGVPTTVFLFPGFRSGTHLSHVFAFLAQQFGASSSRKQP